MSKHSVRERHLRCRRPPIRVSKFSEGVGIARRQRLCGEGTCRSRELTELNQLHRPGSACLLVSAGAGAVPSRTTRCSGFAEQLQPLPTPEGIASLLELVCLNKLLPCGAV